MNLENELREALRREDAPAGFAGRVLARSAAARKLQTVRMWMAMAALFALAAVTMAGIRKYEERQEAVARKAGQDAALAVKIASAKLHLAKKMIRRRSSGA